jgi:hypothetical protein
VLVELETVEPHLPVSTDRRGEKRGCVLPPLGAFTDAGAREDVRLGEDVN